MPTYVMLANWTDQGVRSIEDPALVAELVRRGTVLEVCPGSNLALGIYRDRQHHPLHRLIEAGVKVTLGSDDPPFFHTSLGAEYELAGLVRLCARRGSDERYARRGHHQDRPAHLPHSPSSERPY